MTGPDPELGDGWPDSEPRTEVPPVDVDLLVRVLRRVEADAHRKGWDSTRMCLFTVYDNRDALTDDLFRKLCGGNPRIPVHARVGTYTAQGLMPPEVLLAAPGLADYEALSRFAFNVAYCPPTDPGYQGVNVLRHALRLSGVVAVGVVQEVWVLQATRADLEQQIDNPVDLVTVPRSVEARKALAADLHGRLHSVIRSRGDKPVAVGGYQMLVPGHGQVDEHPDTVGHGDVPNSLRMLADMITGRTPQDQAGYDARYRGYRDAVRQALAEQDAAGGLRLPPNG